MKPITLLYIIFSLIISHGCKEYRTTETTSSKKIEDPLDNPALINKYNAYVSLNNYVSRDVWNAYNQYLQSVDTITGNVKKGGFKVYFSQTIPHQFKIIEELYDVEPDLEQLEAIGENYIKVYLDLQSPLRKIIESQEIDELKDNNYALVKTQNSKILAAFHEF